MKITLLKNHLGHLKVSDWEVGGAMGRYLIRVGVAEEPNLKTSRTDEAEPVIKKRKNKK